MKQNLAEWLKKAKPDSNCLVITASDEAQPLVNGVVRHCYEQLGQNYYRQTFSADRYFNLQSLEEVISNTSLFGDKNFLEINFKTKPNVEQQRQLSSLLDLVDENTFLCLTCQELDKKDFNSEWFKNLINTSTWLQLSADYHESLTWVQHQITSSGLTIERDALDLILGLNQNNFSQLHQEATKLCYLFNSPHNITLNDVRANLFDNAQYNVFALSRLYLQGNHNEAVKVFRSLCRSIDEAILVIWNLGEDLRKLIQIKAKARHKIPFMQAIEGLRIWGDSVNNFQVANQRISYVKLLDYLNELAGLDFCIKGVIPGEPLVLLENLIINICLGR